MITNSRPCHEIDRAEDLFKLTQAALFLDNDGCDKVMVRNAGNEECDVEMVSEDGTEEVKNALLYRSDSKAKGSKFKGQKQVREIEYK